MSPKHPKLKKMNKGELQLNHKSVDHNTSYVSPPASVHESEAIEAKGDKLFLSGPSNKDPNETITSMWKSPPKTQQKDNIILEPPLSKDRFPFLVAGNMLRQLRFRKEFSSKREILCENSSKRSFGKVHTVWWTPHFEMTTFTKRLLYKWFV